jgi:hypothetical protein
MPLRWPASGIHQGAAGFAAAAFREMLIDQRLLQQMDVRIANQWRQSLRRRVLNNSGRIVQHFLSLVVGGPLTLFKA